MASNNTVWLVTKSSGPIASHHIKVHHNFFSNHRRDQKLILKLAVCREPRGMSMQRWPEVASAVALD